MRRLTKTANLNKTRREIEDTFVTKAKHIYNGVPDEKTFSLGELIAYEDSGTYHLAIRTKDGIKKIALS